MNAMNRRHIAIHTRKPALILPHVTGKTSNKHLSSNSSGTHFCLTVKLSHGMILHGLLCVLPTENEYAEQNRAERELCKSCFESNAQLFQMNDCSGEEQKLFRHSADFHHKKGNKTNNKSNKTAYASET